MAIENLRSKNKLIAEHCTTLDFPIQYALVQDLTPEVPFSILVYHERQNYRDDQRSPASDMPFAVWKPGQGLQSLSHEPFYSLVCAGLRPTMETFCEEAYAAFQDQDSE